MQLAVGALPPPWPDMQEPANAGTARLRRITLSSTTLLGFKLILGLLHPTSLSSQRSLVSHLSPSAQMCAPLESRMVRCTAQMTCCLG